MLKSTTAADVHSTSTLLLEHICRFGSNFESKLETDFDKIPREGAYHDPNQSYIPVVTVRLICRHIETLSFSKITF